MVDEPAMAVIAPPTQVVEVFGDAAMVRPAGRMSVKSRAVAAIELELLSIVNCSVDVPPALIASGENTLLNVGAVTGAAAIVSVSVAAVATVRAPELSVLVVLM